MVNEPSVFEPLKVDCTMIVVIKIPGHLLEFLSGLVINYINAQLNVTGSENLFNSFIWP